MNKKPTFTFKEHQRLATIFKRLERRLVTNKQKLEIKAVKSLSKTRSLFDDIFFRDFKDLPNFTKYETYYGAKTW